MKKATKNFSGLFNHYGLMNVFIHERRLVISDVFLFYWCHFV